MVHAAPPLRAPCQHRRPQATCWLKGPVWRPRRCTTVPLTAPSLSLPACRPPPAKKWPARPPSRELCLTCHQASGVASQSSWRGGPTGERAERFRPAAPPAPPIAHAADACRLHLAATCRALRAASAAWFRNDVFHLHEYDKSELAAVGKLRGEFFVCCQRSRTALVPPDVPSLTCSSSAASHRGPGRKHARPGQCGCGRGAHYSA